MVVIASMIVWVSACLLSSAASASSATPTLTTTAPTATHVALKSRAEVFLGVSLKNVERSELSPVNATRYYDVLEGVVLECLVTPKGGLNGLPGRIGKTGPIKEVPDAKALDDLFDSLSSGGKTTNPGTYPGVVKELPDGTIIRRRPGSKSGGATLDITMPDGTIVKVHIKS